ncbi:hypothetical protein ASF33_02485 [Methylobacterium sp. Leaf92]|nr:hypothetical protein ASF33_02485 [Methylobacterium sp. Leaf92]
MIAASSTAVAYSLAAYLMSAEIVDATTIATSRDSAKVMEPYGRSYVPRSSWAGDVGYSSPTSGSEMGILVAADRPEEITIAAVVDFLDLNADWDGDGAAAPNVGAVVDAVRFINAAGGMAAQLEPTLHVDGSVILEFEDGSAGSLRFRGDGTVIYAIDGVSPGVAAFDGYTVPEIIGGALRT